MQNSWITWVLPFGMIAYCVSAGIIEMILTPNSSRSALDESLRASGLAPTNRAIRQSN